jgi:hypothetical protein
MAGEPADAFYQKEISPNGPEVRLWEVTAIGYQSEPDFGRMATHSEVMRLSAQRA